MASPLVPLQCTSVTLYLRDTVLTWRCALCEGSVLTEYWLQPRRPREGRRGASALTSGGHHHTSSGASLSVTPSDDDAFGWNDMIQRRIWDSPASRRKSMEHSPRRAAAAPRARAVSFTGVLSSRAAVVASPPPKTVHLLWFLFWVNLYQVLAIYSLFWLDMLPHFGM